MTDTDEPLRIDVVSDVVCPWCFINGQHAGSNRRSPIAAGCPGRGTLPPLLPQRLHSGAARGALSRTEYLTTKFGSVDRYNQNAKRLVAVAASEGLTYSPEKIQRQPNTIDCHRLIYWADQQGNAPRMKQRLMSL